MIQSSPHVDRTAIAKEYLKSSKVLIVDQNPSARIGLKKLIISLGASLNQIFLANSFEEAEEIIRDQKPNIVFCDYQIGPRFGLDLLQKQREEYPKETGQSLFILVTSNTSQSAVAQAAEEDIDAFVLKPYTIEGFGLSVARAIQIKIQPSEYLKLINRGKELLDENKFDDAISMFQSAMDQDNKPSLACFYEGLTYFKTTCLEGSQNSFQKGIVFNKIHYKCLVGLFDLLMSLKKYDAAYEIVQKIVRFFPANPKRLATVLKLAIQTKNYSDIDSFYQEFLKIDGRNEELIKCVCAALIVCGKHFLEMQDSKTGVDFIQKACVTAAGRHFILRKAVEAYIRNDQIGEAKSVLKRFSNPTEEDSDYAIASFLINSKELKLELVINKGVELLRKGFVDIELYRITADSLEKHGLKDRAQELRDEAVKHYPELNHEAKKAA